ncbi:MAG: EamA family transporter RarD [Comamonadaceae bacterium]|nr:MAG: EamA family transporter RarD [Comamonadaceae bacterium]
MLKGLTASVLASALFGALYYLAPLLAPLDGEQIFGWRVLLTVPFTTALLLWQGQAGRVRTLALRAWRGPSLALALGLSAFLLGVQLWLFLWAPLHGRALPVSLGYFLLPLTMVLTGRLLYRERLTPAQLVAAVLAGIGVLYELSRAGSMSWETALVALGYPVYFVLRRRLGTDHLGGHWVDMVLMTPVAAWFVMRAPSTVPLVLEHSHLWALLPTMGLLSGVALALYMAASRLLPLGLFGLLSYVEPALLVVVALLLGESLAPGQWAIYGAVVAAVVVLVGDGVWRLMAGRRNPRPPGRHARER